MKGVNPEWKKLRKRHCDDCGESYKPKQPLRPNTRGFCSDNCRKSYHKHGGAYRKLRVEVRKMVEKEFGPIHAMLIDLMEKNETLREQIQEFRRPAANVSPLPNPRHPR